VTIANNKKKDLRAMIKIFTPNYLLRTTIALSIGASVHANAAQVATDPGDYNPLPAGVDLGLLYYQHTTHNDVYVDNNKVPAGMKLATDIGLLRWVHFTDIGGYTADPQIIVPFGNVSLDTPAGNSDASGIGDPMVGGTLWLYNNKETNSAFGVTALVSVPVGHYNNSDAINIGENRWKLITQAAYTTPIAKTFSLDVVGEYSIFGDNNDFVGGDLKQDPQYGIQAHLSKHLSPKTRASFSYFHDFGAETQLAGVDQDNDMNNSRWQVSISHFVQPDLQVLMQYGQSIKVKNGFAEENRINLRIVKVF